MPQRAYFILVLLTLPLAAFVTSGCSGQKELIAEQESELQALQADNRSLRAELAALQDTLQFYQDIESGQYYRDRRMLNQEIQRLKYNVAVCVDGGRTIETLLVDDLFEPASATLTDDGRQFLRGVADTLQSKYLGRTLRVEGHSDSTPIGPSLADTYPSNWELSADRAAAVVRFFVDEVGLPAGQLELASFGASRPIAKNDTAEGRRRNRRIRVAVMPQ